MTTGHHPTEVERYERFFGFHEAPFSLAPNPRYLFQSASHTAALAQVAYAIERREPLVVVTGEIGTGKTLLCRTVLQRLEPKTFVSVVNNPLLERDDLLKQLLQDFGVISKHRTAVAPTSRHDLVHALEDFLTSLIALRAHAVVLIDEAQHIQPEVLEQIRLLSNIDDPRGTMLQIILVGQADLESLLSRPELRQFQQRVSRRVRLEPLSADELRLYIEHRLAVGRVLTPSAIPGADVLAQALAEWEGPGPDVAFTADAIQAIWTVSRGLPRVVNLLCDRALEAACAQGVRKIDVALVNAAEVALRAPSALVECPPEPASFNAAENATPVAIEAASMAPAPRAKRPIKTVTVALLLMSIAVVVVAIWIGTRGSRRSVDPQPVARPDGSGAPTAPAPVRSTPAPPSALPTGSALVGITPPARASGPAAAGSPAAAGEIADGRFDIVVASFRTEARAASVAADVSSLGLPVRRRVVVDWQQVIAGPFASRAEADEAQRRLDRAGLTNTQMVPAGR